MNPANTPLRLLHVTDPHLHAHAESRMRGVVTYDTFRAVIKHATSSKLAADAILATGDLVQDETRTGYERFSEVLTPLQKPVLCIPGNHDAPNIMASTLAPPLFQVGGSWQRQGWSVILLSSFARGDDGGQLSTEELHRLENLLTEHADLHTLVCLHHHPVPMGSAWLDGVALRNADELMQIIDRAPQVRGIVWGHVHQASDRMRNDVHLISSPSTCSQFKPDCDTFEIDDRPPGYRWIELHGDGTISTEVIWLD